MLLQVAGRGFKPSLLPTLATVLLLILLLGLAWWQWQRAEQKQLILNAFEAQLTQPRVALREIDAPEKALYQPVSAQGRYDSEQQILLDNQIYQGQPGYLVYTPLQLEGRKQAILVNRGWIPLGQDRSQIPQLPLAVVETRVQGRLGQAPNPGIRLENPATSQWPKVVQHIDYAELATELSYPLTPVVILLDPAAPDGFVRDWQPAFGGMLPQKHIAYAVQWLALAVTLLILYFVTQFKRVANTSK